MKTTLKNIIGGATLGLALLANTSPTWAGAKFQSEVVIEPTPGVFGSMDAFGSMNGARYSKDKKQVIGCRLFGTEAFWFASCSAVDSTGASLGCLTSNPDMLAAVSAMTDSAFISFRRWEDSIECVKIRVDGSSAQIK